MSATPAVLPTSTPLTQVPSAAALPSKNHYQVLDGLRGVAALIVVAFHILEVYSGGDHTQQILNHGYLAVDFFFLLSGFVVAYAYDDRWNRMTQWEFYKRRLIRLQPMVIIGSIIGAALFYLGKGPVFTLIAGTPFWKVLLVMLVGCTLLPLWPSLDIRGWSEMHPLDGPAWSLFFEYIANILYGAGLRRLSKKALSVFVLLSAVFLVHLAVTSRHGDVIGGWSLTPGQLHVGFARLLFPFFAGVLLMRSGWRIPVRGAFGVCSLLLALVLCFPRVGGTQHLWVNGLYDSFAIIVLFPLIIAMGAGAGTHGNLSHRLSGWLGGISYPLYITHYPLIYAYYAWVLPEHITPGRGALVGVVLFTVAASVAFALLKLYDEPVRGWLSRRFLAKAR